MPSYMQRMVEQQLGTRGFALQDLAVLGASLEHLVHDDVIARLQAVFEVHDLPLTTRVDETLVDQAIDTYMMVYIQGSNLTGMDTEEVAGQTGAPEQEGPQDVDAGRPTQCLLCGARSQESLFGGWARLRGGRPRG